MASALERNQVMRELAALRVVRQTGLKGGKLVRSVEEKAIRQHSIPGCSEAVVHGCSPG